MSVFSILQRGFTVRGPHIVECALNQNKFTNDPEKSTCEESYTVEETASLTESDLIGTSSSCPEPPEALNGIWMCDKNLRTCSLHCKEGYISLQQVTAR